MTSKNKINLSINNGNEKDKMSIIGGGNRHNNIDEMINLYRKILIE
jgi:hypothetical protein